MFQSPREMAPSAGRRLAGILRCLGWHDRIFILALIGCLSAVGGPTVEGCHQPQARRLSEAVREAILLYESGWAGSDDALREAIEGLETALKEGPSRATPLLRAYLGSAYIGSARSLPGRQKVRPLRRGAAELDRAVKEAPNDLQVRLLRMTTFGVLPRAAGRMKTVENDREWLLEKASNEDISRSCRWKILYQAGSHALRNRDPRALEWLEGARESSREPGEEERVARLLRLATQQLHRDSEGP